MRTSYLPTAEELSDWLHQISEGNQDVFARLLHAYWNKVFTQALTYLKQRALAQEITQDVFLKIWGAREKLPALDNFSNYLFIISRNEIISAMRKKGQNLTGPDDDLPADLLSPDEQLQYKETYNRLLDAINQLPPTRRLVFKMSRLEGRSYDEIGKELGISRNGVKDHIVKALNFLRIKLASWNGGTVSLLVLSSLVLQQ